MRVDLAEDEVAVLERQFPGLAARLGASSQHSQADAVNKVQLPHPATGAADTAVDNEADGVQRLHADGVQPAPLRGAVAAPEPSIEPSGEPPAAIARTPAAADLAVGGGPEGKFFAALGPAWRLTEAQRARLTPAVRAALGAGWTPQALADFTGANTSSIRNAYAVLAARLAPAELPPPGQRPTQPPWCGQCDQDSRMLDFDGDAPRRCPRCKPTVVMSRAPLAEPISIRALGGSALPSRSTEC